MIVGTAGHIDHGKTSLVRALTGVDTDRLKEEKERGISIELGYAYQPLASGEVLGFVDVPGHERFVHTMLAGASGIDFVLLVVAADDGVMPQTREHVQIVDLLGISRGAVALTKIDRVEQSRLQAVREEVMALLARTRLRGLAVFPVSNATLEGIEPLSRFLRGEAAAYARRAREGHFRLAVDRSFTLAGAGTIVTGTVFSGEVKPGDELIISPAGVAVRVRSVHAQNRLAECGRAGERCALNLAGIGKDEVRRGDWVAAAAIHAPTARIDARVRLLEDEARALRQGSSVQVHLGAAHANARVALLEADALAPGASGLAQLVLAKPIGALSGDVFVLRDAAARRTLGGGTVIDPWGWARERRSEHRRAVLAAMEIDDPNASLERLLALAPDGLDLAAFARARNLCADPPCPAGTARVRSEGTELAFSRRSWQALRERTIAGLQDFHARFQDELGPEIQRLRRMVSPSIAPAAWNAIIEEWVAQGGIARNGPWLHLPEHRVTLSPSERTLAQRVVPLLQAAEFDPPWVRDIARDLRVTEPQLRLLMARIARQGELFQVARDLFYPSSTVLRLSRIAADLQGENGGLTAARFRDRTGLGRKRAIQILEFFDRAGYTRRVRDEHRLRGANPFGESQSARIVGAIRQPTTNSPVNSLGRKSAR